MLKPWSRLSHLAVSDVSRDDAAHNDAQLSNCASSDTITVLAEINTAPITGCSTKAMSASSMQAMLPMHRQRVGNMISQMSAEMRQMNMPADTAWNATLDSVREDLVAMPEMSGQQLRDMMPEHHTRLMRLMQMHRDMMSRMQ